MILPALGLLFLLCLALFVVSLVGVACAGSNRGECPKAPDHPGMVEFKRCLWLALDVIFHSGIVMCVLMISGMSWASDVWKTLRERRHEERR